MRMDRFELCDHRELRRVWMSREVGTRLSECHGSHDHVHNTREIERRTRCRR
ncbi:hypothetical protein M758_6G181100 [Ceratodon purpureus]|nr:hypothetical protein M758_6G181100 [Ceratodon purpureus]